MERMMTKTTANIAIAQRRENKMTTNKQEPVSTFMVGIAGQALGQVFNAVLDAADETKINKAEAKEAFAHMLGALLKAAAPSIEIVGGSET